MSNQRHMNEAEIATARLVAAGDGWRVLDVECRAGPHDRPFEEQHRWVSLSAVMEGNFLYRSRHGLAAMTPGSVLLGSAGACFSCGHDHSRGDRCLSFQYDPQGFEEIAAATPGVRTTQFSSHRLPPVEAMSPLFAGFRALLDAPAAQPAEDFVWQFAGATLEILHDSRPATMQPQDTRRMLAVTDHIDRHLGAPLALADLAALAGLSRYHFLRLFRNVIGTTPYRYILARRMARAGEMLHTTDMPVLDIALDCGFSDLSEFTRRFRARFGLPPAAYRRSARKK